MGMISLVSIYLELAKSRLSLMVTLTALTGFLLGAGYLKTYQGDSLDPVTLLWTVLGTLLTSSGANGLNQWWEKLPDRLMIRTQHRPVPSERISSLHAMFWSLGTAVTGILLLHYQVNPLTALLGALTLVIYVLVYTPLKRKTSLCTLAGAICGAIPPMMGWSGATGTLHLGAWSLAAILFLWQIPHFLALSWMYRADYERGGFRMLPIIDPNGRLTCMTIVLYCMALLPIGLSLSMVGVTGWFYAVGSLLLGMMMLKKGLTLQRNQSQQEARSLFITSLIYLSLLMGLMVVDNAVSALHLAAWDDTGPIHF